MNQILPPFLTSPLVRVLAILGFFIGCLAGPGARGQHLCGTASPTPVQYENTKTAIVQLKANLAAKAQKAGTIVWVPLRIHIARRSNGSMDSGKEVDLVAINTALAYANRKFLPADIQFFILGSGTQAVNYINDDVLYTAEYGSSQYFIDLLALGKDSYKALNLYFVKNTVNNIGGFAKFPEADNVSYSRVFLKAGMQQPFFNLGKLLCV